MERKLVGFLIDFSAKKDYNLPMNKQKQIAETILEQLKWGSMSKFWSWGGHNWAFLPSTSRILGGLVFDVQGRKFFGEVRVLLDPSDTYRITLDGEEVANDIYCDQLAEVVDRLVETS